MSTSSPPAVPSTIGSLLLSTTGDDLVALLVGVLVWGPLLVTCHPVRLGSWFADPLALLIVVLGNQAGFLLVGLRRFLSSRVAGGGRRPPLGCSNKRAVLAGVFIALGLILLGLFYDVLLRRLFSSGTPTIGPWGAVRRLGPLPGGLILLTGVLIGPTGEELFFRAVLFGRWADAGRPGGGAVLSALLFALARLDPWNPAAFVVMGLLLAWVYRLTGSLLAPLTAHALTNAAMFALLFTGYQ